MKLTNKLIHDLKSVKTPLLAIDLSLLQSSYRHMSSVFRNIEIFYAMKANDDHSILKTLHDENCSFEISSQHELDSLLSIGVPSSKIMCLNSIKSPQFLESLAENNVSIMAFDSYDEADKIQKYAPQSQLALRIVVDNKGSDWPLTRKFGIDSKDALTLLKYSKRKGLKIVGLTFHVGSQCRNVHNWKYAIRECKEIFNTALDNNIKLNMISLGGGLPVVHDKEVPTPEEIYSVINRELDANFNSERDGMKVTIEPGRGLIGQCGMMVTTVVGKAKRGKEQWVYTDVGVFNGLMETIENFKYNLLTEHDNKKKRVTIAGPSCDSVDVTFKDVLLPEVEVGDRIYIMNAGAYTTVYAARFNGFERPEIYIIN